MIIDSSAIIAIITEEPGYGPVLDAVAKAENIGVGAPTLVETGIVLGAKLGIAGKTLLARFAQEKELAVIPLGDSHWPVAVDAFLRFGKGRHPAGLNFGDCLTYSIAHVSDQPLLCIGNDFPETDLELVLKPVY